MNSDLQLTYYDIPGDQYNASWKYGCIDSINKDRLTVMMMDLRTVTAIVYLIRIEIMDALNTAIHIGGIQSKLCICRGQYIL